MKNLRLILLLLLASTAFGRTNYNSYTMPGSGNLPGWGPVHLDQPGTGVTGLLGLGSGGTNAATQQQAAINVLPAGTTSGNLVQWNGTNWISAAPAGITWATKTANYTVLSTDSALIAGSATSAIFAFTLPAASTVSGKPYYFANYSTYFITLTPNGSDTIFQASSQTLAPGASVILISDGSTNYNAF